MQIRIKKVLQSLIGVSFIVPPMMSLLLKAEQAIAVEPLPETAVCFGLTQYKQRDSNQ